MAKIKITVNGTKYSRNVEDRTLLVNLIRDELGLTGTHIGCDTTQCGACTVHVNGRAVKSCTILAAQASGADVVTIEGLAQDGKLHPVQQAFTDNHALQCGFCTPGMLMTLTEFLRDHPDPTEAEVRVALTGNLCRCTGYQGIVDAALAAARKMREEAR